MVSVRINGEVSGLKTDGLVKVTDLIELVKSFIDPDHMITAISINGGPVSDEEWNGTLVAVDGSVFDFLTGTPLQYVSEQLMRAPAAAQACYVQFRDARKTFQGGDTAGGNQKLITATDTLKAFFDWYVMLLQLLPESEREALSIEENAADIVGSCKGICQLQLYKSWWALGESIQNELEPLLDKLEDRCRKISNNFQSSLHGAVG